MSIVYCCSDTITGLFSAIYDAWQNVHSDEEPKIVLGKVEQPALFSTYRNVKESWEKSVAVERMITKNLGSTTYWELYHAALHTDAEKGTAILRTLLYARQVTHPNRVMDQMTNPYVAQVFEMSRRVKNEAHFYLEILRFRELERGILFAEIEPDCQILTCIANHFEDRFPQENWMIYDRTHRAGLVHEKGRHWIQILDMEPDELCLEECSDAESRYRELWKVFFETIAIESRINPQCQRNHLPYRYRKYLPEFQ